MKIPNTNLKKALFIVDVQAGFIIERNKYIIPNIQKIIKNTEYDLIVYSISYNEKGSLRFEQVGWFEEPSENDTIDKIKNLFINKNHIKINKLSKSIFKGDKDLNKILKENEIQEIHITGYETNDCVLASALESFDYGFYTFVIEEGCETRTTKENHTKAIDLLRYAKLTNNSEFTGNKKIEFIEI